MRTQLSASSFQFSEKNGFTLMEIIVALGVVAIVATIASVSLFSILRSATKTEILKEIKQNGDYSLSVMEIKIRNARDIVSTCATSGTTSNSLTIENPDGTQSTFSCVTSGSVRRLQEQNVQSNYLTNTLVSVDQNCSVPNVSFTCTTSALDGKSKDIDISFTLSQANTTALVTERATQTFGLQISLRNK